ncbi:MAG: hypothetical protein HY769_02565 [Candidatus Stahlbacteria bacterium]|nr:hypothetical protein [Candidatus Stahlbacteria bacterium]
MSLTVRDKKPTLLSEDIVMRTPPPILLVDHGHLRIAIIHWGPNPQNERKNAKPEGIVGVKIWYSMSTGEVE